MSRFRSRAIWCAVVVVCSSWADTRTAAGDGLVPIRGGQVRLADASGTARDRAKAAVIGAYLAPFEERTHCLLKSWEEDLDEKARSYTWDAALALSALVALNAPSERIDPAIEELASRAGADGGFPVEPRTACASGASETASAVAVLAHLSNQGYAAARSPEVRAAIERGARWLRAAWQRSPGLGLAPRSPLASTEGTALAIFAGIELEKLDAAHASEWKSLVVAATHLLSGPLWLQDHFARGVDVSGPTLRIDRDSTGPHTHQTLPVLALTRARQVHPDSTPDPADYDPLPWLAEHFSRDQTSGGRVVRGGIADRLTLMDTAGFLYGCDGGEVSGHGRTSLHCGDGTLRIADPSRSCWSPYDEKCAGVAHDAPPLEALAVLPNVNAELTILAAAAARSLGRDADYQRWRDAALALQRPDGGVIAIAGPAASSPGKPLAYPQTHRSRSAGYTALLGLLLADRQPMAPTVPLGSSEVGATEIQPDGFDLGELDLTAWRPDPPESSFAVEGRTVRFTGETRPDRWIAWRQGEHRDSAVPNACVELRAQVRGEGPWRDLQVTTSDRDGRTFGRTLRGFLGPESSELKLPLDSLGFYWGPEPALVSRRFTALAVVATGLQSVAPPEPVRLELHDPRLVAIPCLEGAPIEFRAAALDVGGEKERFPRVRDLGAHRTSGVRVEYDLSSMHWQEVVTGGRWDWSCARAFELAYRAPANVTVQLKVEDGHRAGHKTGARWFVETTTGNEPRSGPPTAGDRNTWRSDRQQLRVFALEDPRPIDLRDIQLVSIALVPQVGQKPDELRGAIDLFTVTALAAPGDLGPDGSCRSVP